MFIKIQDRRINLDHVVSINTFDDSSKNDFPYILMFYGQNIIYSKDHRVSPSDDFYFKTFEERESVINLLDNLMSIYDIEKGLVDFQSGFSNES